MNEFCAKKLGEVLAFEYLGKETFLKGKDAFLNIFSQECFDSVIVTYCDLIAKIEKVAEKNNVSNITLPKKDKTKDKLSKMQDLYVGDEWDNHIELSEWSGFYEGAAIVHWELVLGIAEKLKDDELEHLALYAIRFHNNEIKLFSETLHENGMKKSE